jgi:hypothetical protein
MDEAQEITQRAAAWGMTPQALAKLLECGKGQRVTASDPDNHHLRFEGDGKIFMRVTIGGRRYDRKLPSGLAKAREARDKLLKQLGFNHQLFIRNREAYNARKNRQA